MTSFLCQRQGNSIQPMGTTVFIWAQICCCVAPGWDCLPQEPHFPHFLSWLLMEATYFALSVFTTIFQFLLPENSGSSKTAFSGVKWSTQSGFMQARARRWFDTIAEGKWLLWWASAALLKMWLKTLTKVTLPAVVMSSSLAKLFFFIKWQHMMPKSILDQ